MVETWIRPHLLQVSPYKCARDEYGGTAPVMLDANENSLAEPPLNRYPDPHARDLRERLSEVKEVPADQILVGNGSDELIDLLLKLFVEPQQDSVLLFPPTYGLYEVASRIHGARIVQVPLDSGFDLNADAIVRACAPTTKLVFVCSPNNPTGNLLSPEAVEALLKNANCPVVIDEAYIDFTNTPSWSTRLHEFKNLIVLQTLSKAWGLAGARVGMLFASPEIVHWLGSIKPPYNVSQLAQAEAMRRIARIREFEGTVETLKSERERLANALATSPYVDKVFPSSANFLLVRFHEAKETRDSLASEGIIVRDRSSEPGCDECLRITVGTPIENDRLLNALDIETIDELLVRGRTVARKRKTNETAIWIRLDLDGSGVTNIRTGIGFFDHMLEQIFAHSGIDATLNVEGDLWRDEHHTIEDTGIAIGEAIDAVLKGGKGITRYGFSLPMDESRAEVLLDLCGRRNFVWRADFKREKIGDMPTEMFPHFFRSLADGLRATLHVNVVGENEHHMIESVFKAVGRALRQAVKADPNTTGVPSTKGLL